MAPRVRLLSTIAGAALLVSVLLIAVSQIRRAGPSLSKPAEEIASGPRQSGSGLDKHGPIAAGEKAAPFKLTDLSGDSVSMADLRGKVVFLNIWATWCAPCREEMPSMEKLYQRLHDNKGFVMLAVSQDTESRDEVVAYVKKHGYHFDVLLDPKNAVAEAYKVSGVPETFIIDRAGRIVAHHSGAFDWSQPAIRDALEELLKDNKG
jgi:peroxiredoxin